MSNQVKRLTLSAFFLALGLVLPFVFIPLGRRQELYFCRCIFLCCCAGLSVGRPTERW